MFSNVVIRLYKPLAGIIFVVAFFSLYNTYLVDRSLTNFKIALEQTAGVKTTEDFKKIKALLKIPLFEEISKTRLSGKNLVPLEMADNLTRTAETPEQIEEVRYYLKSLIEAKELERGGFLSALDNLNARIFRGQLEVPKDKLLSQAKKLLGQVDSLKDKRALQRLYFDLGNIYLQLSELSLAEEVFLKAVEVDPETNLAVKSIFNLAWGFKTSGQHKKSVEYFDKLIKRHDEMKIRINSEFQVADVMYKEGDYQKARDMYDGLNKKYPDFDLADLALYEAGHISYYELNDREAALKYFGELEEKSPKSKLTKHIVEEVRPIVSTAIREEGFKLLEEKKYLEAISKFNEAIQINSTDSQSYSGLGLGNYWMENKVEAVDSINKAVSIADNPEITIINAMFVYINTENLDEAIRAGEEYLSKKITIKRPEFYYNLGYAYALKSELNEATTYFNATIRLNSDFVFAYNNLGCSLWAVGKYSDALRKFQEATDRNPSYADAYFNSGVGYFFLSRYEEAYNRFQMTMDVKPDYKEAKEYLDRIRDILKYRP